MIISSLKVSLKKANIFVQSSGILTCSIGVSLVPETGLDSLSKCLDPMLDKFE